MPDEKKGITKLTLVIDGEEKIKQFSLILAHGLQGGGMSVVDLVADLKKQVTDQVDKK